MTEHEFNNWLKGDDLHPGQEIEPPWEPFWDCRNFATDDCLGLCNHCLIREEYVGPARW